MPSILYDRLRVIELAKNARIHTTDILKTLQSVMDAMVDQETGVRGYLIAGDEKYLEPYHKGIDAYTKAIQSSLCRTRRHSRRWSVKFHRVRSPIIEFVLTGADSTCG